MYVHWTHHYLPKVFAVMSYIFNPLFIYLILTDPKSAKIGKYRFLLLFFAFFDMTYTLVELIVPMGIHGTGSAFMGYLAGGPFFESEEYGQFALSIRTSFVASSYGILMSHFIYRYIVLHRPRLIDILLKPFGMVCILIFVLLHGLAWVLTVEMFLYEDDEIRGYVYEDFMKSYNVNSFKISMLSGIYYDVSLPTVRRSWIGVGLVTCISAYAIFFYFLLGFKIMKKLKEHRILSIRTAILHKQLFKALAIQTFIPIFISFTPCCIAWYSPMFGINVGTWNNLFGVVALSAFPTLDPLAIILLLPNYRSRVINMIPVRKIRKVAHLIHSESGSNAQKVASSTERFRM